MTLRSQIIGCGSYLPENILTNEDLAAMVDTSDRWIVERTGIRQRHIAADGELTSDLAFHSAENALMDAGMAAQDLDMIVLATTTPDNTFPATATKVQAMLGLTRGAAFDVQAVCSGFLYGLSVGDNFIKTGQVETVLVIGAETFSRIIDWEDRSTCVIFGDGAGSVVLKGSSSADGRGILSTHLHSDGRLNDLLYVDGGPSSSKSVGHVRMSGREVYRHAVLNMSAIVKEAVEANGLRPEDIDWVVPHQANKRILDSTTRKLGLNDDRVVITIDRHANTSAASIPLALDEAIRDGRIQSGHLVLMEALGGGLTWAASLVRW